MTCFTALVDCDGLASLVKRRMQLPKAVVRKAAVLALESIIMYNNCENMLGVRVQPLFAS